MPRPRSRSASARAWVRPTSDKGMSVLPCQRPMRFHSVSPCRARKIVMLARDVEQSGRPKVTRSPKARACGEAQAELLEQHLQQLIARGDAVRGRNAEPVTALEFVIQEREPLTFGGSPRHDEPVFEV